MKKVLPTLAWILLGISNLASAAPSVAFFYGNKAPLPQLCFYDWIVIDPYSNFAPNDCQPKTQAFAYVSVGEVDSYVPYAKDIRPTWVIGRNQAWNNSRILDQSNPEWQSFFIQHIIDPLWKQGYRGFFLDTLDSYFLAVHDSKAEQQQIAALVTEIQSIKQRYPTAKIILNRGFQFLDRVAPQIDAVVIESLYHGWFQEKSSYASTPLAEQRHLLTEIEHIRRLKKPVIIIDYLPPSRRDKAAELAAQIAQQGLIPWISDKSLQEIYNNPYQNVPRKILMMFSDEKKLPIQYIPAALYVSPILEYMGYISTYFNLAEQKIFPQGDLKQQYVGIVVWLEKQEIANLSLLQWIQVQIKQGIPVVFLNSFGVPVDSSVLVPFGLASAPLQDSIETLKITQLDPKVVGYEIPPIKTPYNFYPLSAHVSRVLLQLQNANHQTEDAIAITPWGGYALNPYVIQTLPNELTRWVINPFAFFQQALRLKDRPIPDTTTENGRRLMSVHIDGDGFSYPAKWIGGRFAAEELRDQILKKFPIPTSFSVITGELSPNGSQPELSAQLMTIARSIFALPWVEMASHSFSHPFNWQINEPTLLKQPLMPLPVSTPPGLLPRSSGVDRSVDSAVKQFQGPTDQANAPTIHPEGASSAHHQRSSGGTSPYRRQSHKALFVPSVDSEQPYVLSIPNYSFNLEDEIIGSTQFINQNLAPAHKHSHLIFWSGLANPSAHAVAISQKAKLLNINGLSNTNIDISDPSLTKIRPMGMAVGDYYQVFAPIQMDFFYMNSFLGPLYGFEKVIQTFQLTDKPRRMKPIDIYYHVYAASQPAALRALKTVYRWALAQPVMNIYISAYIKKVLDYYQIKIGRYGSAWTFYSQGDLRELRSQFSLGYPDFKHSVNVIGFQENNDDRYIHLGPHRFTVLHYQSQKPTEPYLVEANARVTHFSRGLKTLDIQFRGHMPLQMKIANVNHCSVIGDDSLSSQKNQDNTITYFSTKDSGEIHIHCG